MASGWNLWVWLVSVVVRRYIIDILIIIITFPYSTYISSFFGSIILISLFIFKCFFVLVYYTYELQCFEKFIIIVILAENASFTCKLRRHLLASMALTTPKPQNTDT